MSERDPIEDALRRSLAEHARQAPEGGLLAERILHAVDRAPATAPRRGWRTWALPVVAAGSVATIVGAVVGLTARERPHAAAPPPAGSRSAAVTAAPSSPAPPTSSAPASPTPPRAAGLTHVRILDLTFTGTDSGWALASADCLSGPGTCTALLRTTDGSTWHPVGGAAFNVPGTDCSVASLCVQHLRFADQQVGYAYGPGAFFMTVDGGASWQQQPGGADALETLDGNVIRVSGQDSARPVVRTAGIGSAAWTTRTLTAPARPVVGQVTLARGGSDAYLLLPASTGPALYRSGDDGRSWQRVAAPCGSATPLDVAAGAAGRVTVLCVGSGAQGRSLLAVSRDGGRHFGVAPGRVATSAQQPTGQLAGDPDTVLVAASAAGVTRSADAGRSWQPVTGIAGTVDYLGFESPTVGRAITATGRVYVTRDAGASWQAMMVR